MLCSALEWGARSTKDYRGGGHLGRQVCQEPSPPLQLKRGGWNWSEKKGNKKDVKNFFFQRSSGMAVTKNYGAGYLNSQGGKGEKSFK